MTHHTRPEIPEHKVATHDGFLWPCPRHRMTVKALIVERMAEDAKSWRRAYGDGPIDLTLCGWTLQQVIRYGAEARERALRTCVHPLPPRPETYTVDMTGGGRAA